MVNKVVIIGSGPAGLTAAIYAARAKLDPVVFEGVQIGGTAGGQLMTTGLVENFPGWPEGIDGQELMMKVREQAENLGTKLIMDDIIEIKTDTKPFTLITSGKEEIQAESIIIATGALARRLPLESEQRLWGRGISACAVCDGGLPMFRNKPLAVIGGGDSAVEEAEHLTNFGSKVYLIHRRDELRAGEVMKDRAIKNPKIDILWNKVPVEFLGDDVITGIKLKDTKTDEISEIEVAGAFEAIGHVPNTKFLDGQLELNEEGYIVTKPDTTLTSVAGIFAAGDVMDSDYQQAITSAGTGCKAALDAENYLRESGVL